MTPSLSPGVCIGAVQVRSSRHGHDGNAKLLLTPTYSLMQPDKPQQWLIGLCSIYPSQPNPDKRVLAAAPKEESTPSHRISTVEEDDSRSFTASKLPLKEDGVQSFTSPSRIPSSYILLLIILLLFVMSANARLTLSPSHQQSTLVQIKLIPVHFMRG